VSIFEERAEYTETRLAKLKEALQRHLGTDGERILAQDTCIYVVGSGGRKEMSEQSDVDLFVVRVARPASDLDNHQVRLAVTRAQHDVGLPEPSQGGKFLKMHTAEGLLAHLGEPADDASNAFTARMLLMLESAPLLGNLAYGKLLRRVVDAYCHDVEAHPDGYQPFFLVNDIVRYWRSLLLNYAAKVAEKGKELAEPDRETDRRLRSYKLRFSRCMMCFSALASLLATTASGGVTVEDVLEIAGQSPIERLRGVRTRRPTAATHVAKLLELYASFLEVTARPPVLLAATFAPPEAKQRADEGRQFADVMFDFLHELGRDGRGKELFRHMVV
jgi:hypothetical protein